MDDVRYYYGGVVDIIDVCTLREAAGRSCRDCLYEQRCKKITVKYQVERPSKLQILGGKIYVINESQQEF